MIWVPRATDHCHSCSKVPTFPAEWAKREGFSDMKALEGTVDWVYDCTLAYDDTVQGGMGSTDRTSLSCGRCVSCSHVLAALSQSFI